MEDLGKLAQDISVLHRQFYKDMNDKYKQYSLNPTAACILLAIAEEPGVIQKDICRSLVIDKGLATREINRMQQLNYIQKESGEGRTVKLTLGQVGQKIAPEIKKIRQQWWANKFDSIDIPDKDKMINGIETVVLSIQEGN